MNIYTIGLGDLQANCHIAETGNGNCVAFDIGGEPDKFLDFINSKNLKLTKIFLTHGHFDHTEGVRDVQLKTGAEVYIHTDDAGMLSDEITSLYNLFQKTMIKIENYKTVNDGDVIEDGDIKFTVMHTPGHTKGSVCYLTENEIFSGDTLFAGSIGRTSYPGGNFEKMSESLRKLKALEGDYKIYAGHSESTTLKNEKLLNPFMVKL